ncbi:MAG: hypothetical protein ACRERU_17765, partial [Methylococcales bacterium]
GLPSNTRSCQISNTSTHTDYLVSLLKNRRSLRAEPCYYREVWLSVNPHLKKSRSGETSLRQAKPGHFIGYLGEKYFLGNICCETNTRQEITAALMRPR